MVQPCRAMDIRPASPSQASQFYYNRSRPSAMPALYFSGLAVLQITRSFHALSLALIGRAVPLSWFFTNRKVGYGISQLKLTMDRIYSIVNYGINDLLLIQASFLDLSNESLKVWKYTKLAVLGITTYCRGQSDQLQRAVPVYHAVSPYHRIYDP